MAEVTTKVCNYKYDLEGLAPWKKVALGVAAWIVGVMLAIGGTIALVTVGELLWDVVVWMRS